MGIFRAGLAPIVSYSQLGNAYQEFSRGNITMWMTGPWNLGEFRHRLSAAEQKLWMTAPLPAPDGADWPGVSFSGGSSLAIFRGSERKPEAWKVIEFLSEPAVQARFYALTGDLPACRAAWTIRSRRREDPSLRIQVERVVDAAGCPVEQIARNGQRHEPPSRAGESPGALARSTGLDRSRSVAGARARREGSEEWAENVRGPAASSGRSERVRAALSSSAGFLVIGLSYSCDRRSVLSSLTDLTLRAGDIRTYARRTAQFSRLRRIVVWISMRTRSFVPSGPRPRVACAASSSSNPCVEGLFGRSLRP